MTLIEQASLVLIPSGYKEDTVYSVIPSNGSGDMSFTRASNGTRINSDGLVENTPWNLFTYSEQFQNANWTGGGNGKPTMTDNFAEAPNGTFTASKMVAASDGYQIRQNNAIENTQMNLSVYLRTNTGTKTIQIFLNNGSTAFTNATVTTTWQRFEINGTVTTLVGSGRNGLATLEALTSSEYILVWGAQISVSSTAKPYFPTTDRLNVPRLTYQNGGGGCPSLLLEPQRTNLVKYSQDISNISGAYWVDGSAGGGTATLTANYAISPDGTQNATRLQLNEGAGRALWQQFLTVSIGVSYTYSIWLKSLSGTPTILWLYDGLANQNITVTNQWVRHTFTYTSSSASTFPRFAVWSSVWGTSSTADILAYGAQLEQGSYATSYIPTVASSATRIVDTYQKAGIGNTSTAGTLYYELIATNISSANGVYLIQLFVGSIVGGPAYSEANSISIVANGNQIQGYNNLYTRLLFTITPTIGSTVKIAIRYNGTNVVAFVDGTKQTVYADTSVGVKNALRVNNGEAGSQATKELIFFPTDLTDAECIALTTI